MRLNSLALPCSLLLLLLPPGGALVTQAAPPGPENGFHPVLVIQASYPGASAPVLADTVASPIEQEVNGVEHLRSMVSRCTDEGQYTCLLSFGLGINLDATQLLVQNRVSLAMAKLPAAVQKSGVTVRKLKPGALLLVALTSPDGDRDVVYLGNYAAIQIRDELARVPGVGAISLVGGADFGVRVNLDREKLAARHLTADDVLKALRAQNLPEKARPVDRPADLSGGSLQILLETSGRLSDLESFTEIVLKTSPDGSLIHLKDVATVELGRWSSRGDASLDGRPTVLLAVSVLPAARSREVSAAVRERMEQLKKSFPPGLDYSVVLDLAPSGGADRAVHPSCLLAEPVLPPTVSAERSRDCRNRYAEILRKTEGVRHALSLPENPFTRFRGGPCVVAVFGPEMHEADWERTRQAIRERLTREIQSADLLLRDLAGPAGVRPGGYPVDLALRGPDAREVREFAEALAERLRQAGKLTDVTSCPASAPRLDVEIDRKKAAVLGVKLADVTDALQFATGAVGVAETNLSGRTALVPVRLDGRPGGTAADLGRLQVRTANGQLVPLSVLAAVREVEAPTSVERLDLWPAASVSGNPAVGVSLAEARWLCETLAEQVRKERRLPDGYVLVWLQEVPAPKPVREGVKPAPEPGPPEVTVASPVSRMVADYQDFTGRVEAVESVELRARVTGYLDKVLFKDGTDVKKGDILFAIDPRPYQCALDQAQAGLKAAEAQREVSKRTLERLRGAAAAKAELDVAEADYHGSVARAEAARAAAEIARLNLDWTKVSAPIDGRIGRHLLDPGNLVKADETLLATLVNLDPLRVYFDVDERTLLRLERLSREGKARPLAEANLPAFVGLADDEGFPRRGSVNYVDNRVHPETGTVTMRATLPNPDRALRPGLFARVRLMVGAPHPSLLVPEEALGSDQGQKTVYVVDREDKVVVRVVRVGAREDRLRVITEGLQPDDRVITEGRTRVRQGQTVKPVPGKP